MNFALLCGPAKPDCRDVSGALFLPARNRRAGIVLWHRSQKGPFITAALRPPIKSAKIWHFCGLMFVFAVV
jgi:hypothetical protein